ncbi:MAG TPA: site-specific integrase [Phycisphaerae bacterium]|nr:site-specific integrase [Phycisphaerae bacterium]
MDLAPTHPDQNFPRPVPRYRRHKSSGRGVVRLNGRDFYLGKYGSADGVRRYQELVSQWLAGGRRFPEGAPAAPEKLLGLTVAELCKLFQDHLEAKYTADGKPTSEASAFRQAIRVFENLYAGMEVSAIGPRLFAAAQHAMIEEGWSRKNINRQMGRLKSIFKWAHNQEHIPSSAYERIRHVPGLQCGRSAARESEPVRPAPQALVDAVLPLVSAEVRAMIELQLLTGMRPGEVTIMRGRDLTMAGKVWRFQPAAHKTAYRGHARIIWLGPRAQEVIRPFLTLDPAAPLFRPSAAETARNQARRRDRKTPLTPSALARREMQRSSGTAGDVYGVASYRRAIARACAAAFPPPAPLAQLPDETRAAWRARLSPENREELAAWNAAHSWHPHQLRHNAATEIRARYGIETARIILGHRSAAITEVYAERDLRAAERVMEEVG